ncbi:hypothetical protein M5689_009116 [Euphorbia peplus]|nr:hypothetical protein M5689_009116 [Euphorbia peplus]
MGEKNDIVVYAPTPSVTKSSLTTSGRLVSKKVQCALKEEEPLVLGAYERDLLLGYAGDALELYHKSHKDDDFQIIQPSDDKPGPDEHCSICSSYYGRPPPDFGKYKAHPDPGNYKVGAPPYYEGGWDFL